MYLTIGTSIFISGWFCTVAPGAQGNIFSILFFHLFAWAGKLSFGSFFNYFSAGRGG